MTRAREDEWTAHSPIRPTKRSSLVIAVPDAFAAAAREAADLAALNVLFQARMRGFGFTAHAAGILVPREPAQPMLLVDWPRSWLELYAAQGFAGEDPSVAEAIESPAPFTWAEVIERRPETSRRIFAACVQFGWRDGFVVPVHGPGDARGIVNMAAPEPWHGPRAEVEQIALIAYHHARRLQSPSIPAVAKTLTPRERAAVELVAQGKDDAEIARLLGVTRTTAHAHVERAKRRLGAATRAHAVALALVQRQI